MVDGTETTVAFASCTLSSSETNYSTIEQGGSCLRAVSGQV